MTNSQTPQNPQGHPPASGGAPQQPPSAPQSPFAPQPSEWQPGYAGGSPGGQHPQQYPQQQFAPAQPPRLPRSARPSTNESGAPYGVGPFTLREAWFLGASVLVFLGSLLPFVGGEYAEVFGYTSAWAPAPWLAIPAALILVAAAALVALRRLAPRRSLRVGSLSVDQFASAASVATAGFYLGALFFMVGFPAWFGGGSQLLVPGAGVIVGLLFSLLAVVLTTVAPVIPPFRREFAERPEVGAHPVARPAAAVPIRPRPERPSAPEQQAGYAGYPGQPGVPMQPAGPGEYAAYQRRGSQPAPAYDPEATFPARERVAREESEAAVVEPRTAEETGAADEPSAADEPRAADERATEEAPTATDSRPETDAAQEPQPFAPGFVATDVPAVDPDGVAAVPAGSAGAALPRENVDSPDADRDVIHSDDIDRADIDPDDIDRADIDPDHIDPDDVDPDDIESGEQAPVSAFSHVSAQAASRSADDRTEAYAAADDVESGTEEPAVDPHGQNTTASTVAFSTQPFWVYSPVPRPVVDEQSGRTVFEIGPTAWALAIVDRGSELVIRHDDGRVGVLRDLTGITRG